MDESNAGALLEELCDCPKREQYVQFLKLWTSKLPDFPLEGKTGWGTWVNFCWVRAADLSEPLPHYSLFCAQLQTSS